MKEIILKRIEKLQKANLRRLDYDIEDYLSLNENLFNSIEKRVDQNSLSKFHGFISDANPITKYQAKNYFWALSNVFDEMKFMLDKYDAPESINILLATVFSGKLTGQVLHSKEEGYALIIDEALLMQSGILSKILYEILLPPNPRPNDTLLSTDKNEIFKRIECAQYSQSVFNDCLLSFVVQGSASFAKYNPLSMKPREFNLYSLMSKAINQFVVGHELGHIISRHLESDKFKHLIGNIDITDIDEKHDMPKYKTKQLMELEADIISFDACISMSEDDVSLSFRLFAIFSYLYFIETLFSSLELWVRGRHIFFLMYGKEIFKTNKRELRTNFQGHIRAKLICSILKDSPMSKSRINSIAHICECAEVTIRCLWDNFLDSAEQDVIDKIPVYKSHKNAVNEINSKLFIPYDPEMTEEDINKIIGVKT